MKPLWGIVTDEVCQDPLEALQAVDGWNLHTVEIRGTGCGRRVPDMEPGEIKAVAGRTRQLGLKISALSPGTWKCSLHDAEAELQAARFARTLDLAEQMEVVRVITFAVRRSAADDASTYGQVLDQLGEMSLKARQRGITLCIENERGWWADTEQAIRSLLQDLADTGLRLNWDAANFVDAGEKACPEVFQRLQPWVENIHLKDICGCMAERRWCLLGDGQVGWPELLPVILACQRQIPLSIETHCAPLLENSLSNRQYLRQFEGGRT